MICSALFLRGPVIFLSKDFSSFFHLFLSFHLQLSLWNWIDDYVY